MKSTTFIAHFPSIQSAILVAGDGGMKIRLDIPESQMGAAIPLLTMRGQALRVTVETMESGGSDDRRA